MVNDGVCFSLSEAGLETGTGSATEPAVYRESGTSSPQSSQEDETVGYGVWFFPL